VIGLRWEGSDIPRNGLTLCNALGRRFRRPLVASARYGVQSRGELSTGKAA
jgi:hypothetical protein